MTGIPRVIHRLWLGPQPMPQRFRDYGRSWAELNPGWQVHDWSWHDLPENLANTDVLSDIQGRSAVAGMSAEVATAFADVIAYDLVARFGGVYVNCDIQPVRPLPAEMCDGRAWAAWEDAGHSYVVNSAMGGAEGDPFWRAVVVMLPARYRRLRGRGEEQMNVLHGPHLLTQAHRQRIGLHVFPAETFNPVHWSEIGELGCGATADGKWSPDDLPAVTVGVHHWDHRRTGRGNHIPEYWARPEAVSG